MSSGDRHENQHEITAHADAALRMVRIAIGTLSVFVLGAYRPITGSQSWESISTTLGLVVAAVLGLNAIAKRTPPRGIWPAFTQSLDVLASVVLAVLLAEPLGQQSWVLLIIPVVSAAVRFGAVASFLSWVGGSIGYVVAVTAGAVPSPDDPAAFARIPGTLLAVAITVGVLARWMREGWEAQNELTAAAAAREHRSAVIARAQHALTDSTPSVALEVCANQALSLGFAAVSVEPLGDEHEAFVVGKSSLVASVATPAVQADPVVTVWLDDDDVHGYSVAVHEPQADAIVSAWSTIPIELDHAQSFATLVAHTSTAIETAKLLAELRLAADTDPLTGVANRRSIDLLFDDYAAREGQLAVAFVDLDDFKEINDHYGHDVGDDALVAVARGLETAAGPTGFISRYGGDEFLVLIPNCTLSEARGFADSALRLRRKPIISGGREVEVTLSIGIAVADTPVAPGQLVTSADAALYEAKTAGKATYVAVAHGEQVDPFAKIGTSG